MRKKFKVAYLRLNRILIWMELIGNWVENGEYPNIDSSLRKIVEGISFCNAKRYFGL